MSSLGYLKHCLYLIEKDRKVGEEDVQQRVWTQTQLVPSLKWLLKKFFHSYSHLCSNANIT